MAPAPRQHRRFLIATILVAVAVFLLRSFGFESFRVVSTSMNPTLEVGDLVIVSKTAYAVRIPFTDIRLWDTGSVQRGDIVVFEMTDHPDDSESPRTRDMVKRVVALPGDRVRLQDNTLYVNGDPVPTRVLDGEFPCREDPPPPCRCIRQIEELDGQSFTSQHFRSNPERADCAAHPNWPLEAIYWLDVQVPPDRVVVLGDHRDSSSDTRELGFVHLRWVRGKVWWRWWPPGHPW